MAHNKYLCTRILEDNISYKKPEQKQDYSTENESQKLEAFVTRTENDI